MKIAFLFFGVFFASFALASSLDYGKEAEVATKEAYQSYSKGDMKTLQFALERLTISCNMMALGGADLPFSCVSWFAILKEGCGTGLQENALRECARKFYQERNKRPHASMPPAYREAVTVSLQDERENLLQTLARTYKDALSSFGQAYRRDAHEKPSHLSKKLHAEWAKFLNVYGYYRERALAAMSEGDRQSVQELLSELTYYTKERMGQAA